VGMGLDCAVYRLYACSVCDTKAPLQLRLVVLYKYYAFAFVLGYGHNSVGGRGA